MFAPLQPTPASSRPAFLPARPRPRAAVAKPAPAPPQPTPAAQPAPAPAKPAATPAPALLAAVPEVLAPAVAALAHAAQQQAPYHLLAHALGHDPLTGRPTPAAPLALARTLLGLLPDGEARFQQLQAAGPALAHLPAWLAHQLAAHQLTGARLTQVLAQTWTQLRALGLRDLLAPLAAVERLAQPWLALGQDVARFVGRTEAALLRWLVQAVLGPEQAAPVLRALDQGGDLLLRILRHPLPFLTNLVAASKHGFAAFLAHGPRHLRAAVQDWLLGGLAKAGLHLPARLDLAGLLDLLLQVFDLTKAAVLRRLRQRLPTLPVERLQAMLTQVGGVALTLWQHGPQAAWLAISAHAEGLRAQALDLVQQQVLGVAAKAVPLFLASLAVPGGAFLQVARGLYNGVMLFVEKGKQLAQVGQALFASAAAIAAGQLAPAAQAVENTLVKILPVALSFLARQLGLDGISGAIQTGLQKVRVPVEKAVNKVLDTVADKAKALWNTLKAGAGNVVGKGKAMASAARDKVTGWLGLRERFTVGNEKHTLFFEETELMVASKKQTYKTFIQYLETGLSLSSKAITMAHIKAKNLAGKIDSLLKVAQQKGSEDKSYEIQLLLEQLAPHTITLMQAQLNAQGTLVVSDDSEPVFAGTIVGGEFGRAMHMAYLASTTSRGTEPSVGGHYYDKLKLRRNGDGPYYILGHLLSMQLHGRGNTWENLTPLTGRANGLHETRIERKLKDALAGRAFVYSVLPTYGRAVPQALLQLINQDQPAGGAIITEIVEAEQYVPRSLVAKYEEVEPTTRQKKTGGMKGEEVIPNLIDQSHYADYQLGLPLASVNINAMTAGDNLVKFGIPLHISQTVYAIHLSGVRFRGRQSLVNANLGLTQEVVDRLYRLNRIHFK